jgi:hypothetical protein
MCTLIVVGATGPACETVLQAQIHHVESDQSQRGVIKRLGNCPQDFKAQFLPQVHGAVVRFDNRVELNAVKPVVSCPLNDVLSQRRAHAVSLMIRTHHEAGGRHVRTSPRAIWTHRRRTHHHVISKRDNRETGRLRHPECVRDFIGGTRRIGVRLASVDYGTKEWKNYNPVIFVR